MTRTGGDRPPICWDALAAELATEPTGGMATAAADPVAAWDSVAAELAAGLAAPAAARPTGTGPPRDVRATPGAVVPVDRVARRRVSPPRAQPPRPVEGVVPGQQPPPVPEQATPVGSSAVPDVAATVPPGAVRGALEAVLFVADSPMDEEALAAALGCPADTVRGELEDLAADYDRRRAGVTLRRVGTGWRIYTREEYGDVVERHLLGRQRNRLTQAALETLAVIAYRQPVTRARVSAIRGVGVDAVVRTLVSRGLIRECGTDPDTGGGLYATTELFLERLGLTNLDDLPALAPLLPDAHTVLADHPDS